MPSFMTGVCALSVFLLFPVAAAPFGAWQELGSLVAAPITRLDVVAVDVLVSVRDRKGSVVTHLNAADFKIWDGGKRQQIDYFARQTGLPLSIAVAVDVSKSRGKIVQTESRTAARFLSQVVRENDTASVVSFGSEVTLVTNFTNSAIELVQALDGLQADDPGGVPLSPDHPARGTLLYDALYSIAHDKLFDRFGRKVMIVITDGIDQGSRATRSQVVEAAHRADIVIYGIYSADPSYPYLRGGDVMLQLLTDQTGGRVFHVGHKSKETLGSILGEIEQEMRCQYLLSYTLSDSVPNGTFRSLEVRTPKKNLHVFSRKGYYTGRVTNGDSVR